MESDERTSIISVIWLIGPCFFLPLLFFGILVVVFSTIKILEPSFLNQSILTALWFCSSPVRRASANVVSVIAKYAVPAGEWPDLLPFLFQCSQSVQEDHREVCLTASVFIDSLVVIIVTV